MTIPPSLVVYVPTDDTCMTDLESDYAAVAICFVSNTHLQHFTPVPMAMGPVIRGTLKNFPAMYMQLQSMIC